MPIVGAVPVLPVRDVAASMRWYAEMLGFEGHPFPSQPPHSFAVLTQPTGVEIMLRRVGGDPASDGELTVYLRLDGNELRRRFAELDARGVTVTGLQKRFYGDTEFDVRDPDGHLLCLGEIVEDAT
jgi:uncharacterized glyoxalase superfamily protein PhnB